MFARCITPSWVTYAPGIPLASTAAACKTLRAVSHGRLRLFSSFTKSGLLPTDQHRASFVSTHRLTDSKEIALTVSDLSDAVDRPQARNVVFLEHHSTPSQPLHGRLDVFNLPPHLSSVLSWGGAARLEEHELPLTTAIEQTSGPLFARFETQLLCVERFGPLQILYREPRRDLGVFKHSHRPPSRPLSE